MVDELKKKLSEMELRIIEQDKEIANLRGYLAGANDGYTLAKGDVIELIKELPDIEPNIDSIRTFLEGLTKMIKKINNLEPRK